MFHSFSLMRVASVLVWVGVSCSALAQFGVPQPLILPELGGVASCTPEDIDSDGDLDLICASNRGLHLFDNQGAGNYVAPQPILLRENDAPYATLEDLSGDGILDIVFYQAPAEANEAGVYMMEGLGTGSFDAPVPILNIDPTVTLIELTDINGDGEEDFVMGHASLGVLWCPMLGFPIDVSQLQVASATTSFSRPIIADVDGDTDMDILVASAEENQVACFRNQGTGVFTPSSSIGPTNYSSLWFTAFDLDNDADIDIILDDQSTGNGARIYKNSGTGIFSPFQILTATLGPGFTHADMNSDGLQDLVCGNGWYGNGWKIHLQQGDGTLGASSGVPQGYFYGSVYPVVLDANGDGTMDVATFVAQSNRVSLFLGDGSGAVGPQQFLNSRFGSVMSTYVLDLNNDDANDIVAATSTPDCVLYSLNDGNNGFGAAILLDSVFEASGPTDMHSACSFADIDMDGDVDIVRSSPDGGFLYLNDGSGGFSTPILLVANPTSMVVGDIDNDSDPDLVVAQGITPSLFFRKNNGNGTFAAATQVANVFEFECQGYLDLKDLNGDGFQDIVATDYYDLGTHDLRWYPNLGGNAFNPEFGSVGLAGDRFESIDFADMDNDGDLDALLALQMDGEVRWLMNDGVGQYSNTPSVGIPVVPVYNRCAKAIDVDGDADLDIVWGRLNIDGYDVSSTIQWQRNLGGSFEYGGLVASGPYDVEELTIHDVDDDGDPDILLSSKRQSAALWFENFFNSPFRVEGRVYRDIDENGSWQAGEPAFPMALVVCDPLIVQAITGDSGTYVMPLNEGAYTISADLDAAFWQSTLTPPEYSVQLTTTDPVMTGVDFGYAPVLDTTLLETGIVAPTGPCLATVTQFVYVRNVGTTTPSGIVRLTLDPSLTFIGADPPSDSLSAGGVYWHFDELPLFDEVVFALQVLMPDPSLIGDTLLSSMLVTHPLSASDTLSVSEWQEVLACAYDPNDKQVAPAGQGELGVVPISTSELTWTIRFQNTGTATAEDVVLIDPLPSQVQVSSVTLIATSHDLTEAHIGPDGDLVLRFPGIQLPDSSSDPLGSCGFARFRAALIPGLPHGTQIENSAAIHFDLNPPIITNSTLTTLVDCAIWSPQITTATTNVLQVTEGSLYVWYLNGVPLPGDTSQLLLIDVPGTYTAQVTSEYGCVSITDPVQVLVLPIREESAFNMAVVPNPFTNEARLLFGGPLSPDHDIELVDLSGRTVRKWSGTGSDMLVLTCDGIRAGLYLVRVKNGLGYRGALRVVVHDH